MNSLLVFSVVLWIHIFFGAIALFVAPAAMLTPAKAAFGTNGGAMVAIVFGVIGFLFGMSDMRDFLHHPADKMAWWFTHMARMLAAYIATVTAFSVVNFQFLPPVARWLWATVAGTAGIVIWVRYYRRKFSGYRADRDVTDLGRV